MLSRPLGVYKNWASSDKLPDIVRLPELKDMNQLVELIRVDLKHQVQIVYC